MGKTEGDGSLFYNGSNSELSLSLNLTTIGIRLFLKESHPLSRSLFFFNLLIKLYFHPFGS